MDASDTHANSEGPLSKLRGIFHPFSCLCVLFCVFFFSCAVRPPLFIDTQLSSASLFSLDSLYSLKGYGDISFSYNGERFKASFDIQWHGDSSFSAAFYGPQGMSIASMKPAAAGSWEIEVGDSAYRQQPSGNVNVGRDFLEYPFTWQAFLRILTGRLPATIFAGMPDTVFFDGRHIAAFYKNRPDNQSKIDIITKIDTKTYRLNEIVYEANGKDRWKVIYTGFKKGRPKEIRFIISDNNYFYIRYRSVTSNNRAGS